MKLPNFIKKHGAILFAIGLVIFTFVSDNLGYFEKGYQNIFVIPFQLGVLGMFIAIMISQVIEKESYYKFKTLEREIRDYAYTKGKMGEIWTKYFKRFVILDVSLVVLIVAMWIDINFVIDYLSYGVVGIMTWFLMSFFFNQDELEKEYYCITKDIEVDKEAYKKYAKKAKRRYYGTFFGFAIPTLFALTYLEQGFSYNMYGVNFYLTMGAYLFGVLITMFMLIETIGFNILTRSSGARKELKGNKFLTKFFKNIQQYTIVALVVIVFISMPWDFMPGDSIVRSILTSIGLIINISLFFIILSDVEDVKKIFKPLADKYIGEKEEESGIQYVLGLRKKRFCDPDDNYEGDPATT